MRGDMLKHAIAASLAGIEPTKFEQEAAIADGIDMLFDFLGDVKRIADAAERLAGCISENDRGPSSFTHNEG